MIRYVIVNVSFLLNKYKEGFIPKYDGLDLRELVLICSQVPSVQADERYETEYVYDLLLDKYDHYRNLLVEDDDIQMLIHLINYDFIMMISDVLDKSTSIEVDYDPDYDNIVAEKFIDDNSILLKVFRDESKTITRKSSLYI